MNQEKYKVHFSWPNQRPIIINAEKASQDGLFPEMYVYFFNNFRDAEIVCEYLNKGFSLKDSLEKWEKLIK